METEPKPLPPAAGPAPGNARTWAMVCHLSSLVLYLGLPFGNLIGPLVVWLWQKDSFPEVDDQGKESLNFQLSLTLYTIVIGGITIFLFVTIVGLLLLPVVIVVGLILILSQWILVIWAAIQVNNGQLYRYPLTIRFLE